MEGLNSLVEGSWFNAIQTAGILGGLCFTALHFRQDIKTRQVSNLMAMSERHERLWLKAHEKPELSRILAEEVDFSKPPTIYEREFLNLIIIHFQNGWRVAKTTDVEELKSLATDAGNFFSLPLPHAVWEKTKKYRNRRFVRFVERAMSGFQIISKLNQ
jgi:hypothetical protein